MQSPSKEIVVFSLGFDCSVCWTSKIFFCDMAVMDHNVMALTQRFFQLVKVGALVYNANICLGWCAICSHTSM